MKLSLNWMQDWVELKTTDLHEIAKILTRSSAEVDQIIEPESFWQSIKIGEILEISAHPQADRMRITKTRIGDEVFQIVCGANNIRVGQKVPVATIGTVLPGNFVISQANKRGVDSFGMICSTAELGLTESADGIWELDENAPCGMSMGEFLGKNEAILEIENVTITNRPDLFSQYGFARELVALGLAEWKNKAMSKFEFPSNLPKFPFQINFAQKDLCSAIAGITLENCRVQESPAWIKKRLQSIGINPINNIVDVSNYVMWELGIPLHTFDLELIKSRDINMRLAQNGEKITTLDASEYELPETAIVMDDGKQIFDLCGIMGGENSGIRPETNQVWIHAPVYHPTYIRRTALKLNHRTDASIIYEKRVPDFMVEWGLKRACELLLQSCPEAKISSQAFLQFPSEHRQIKLSLAKVNSYLGEKLADSQIIRHLENLDFKVSSDFSVTIPPHRYRDINEEVDLIEEVVRIHGLDKVKTTLPQINIALSKYVDGYFLEENIKNQLAEGGFEAINYSFLSQKTLTKTLIKLDHPVKVQNPLNQDGEIMRPNLLPLLLNNIDQNYRHQGEFAIFEIGKIFQADANKIQELKNCAYLSSYQDFYQIKNLVQELSDKNSLNLKFSLAKNSPAYFHPGRVGEINFQGKNIGHWGEIHPIVRENWGLNFPLNYFEISLNLIHQAKIKNAKYQEFCRLPKITRDHNFLLNRKDLVADFMKKLEKTPLLVNLRVKELYSGNKIPAQQKCITISATYQAPDHTLSEEEVNQAHQKLVETALKNGASLRE
ncbi:MAG TPA: phenylalanine--tRNA ligase subunit beta [Candidatus Gracilibacteria bacterium]|nr:phenylalanine--tRNA ligase subunit beta [Candidatus Gracilibacteria bacterium]